MTDMIYIPVSPAELIDKVTILEIKASRISAVEKLDNVRFELASLNEVLERHLPNSEQTRAWKSRLKDLNEQLWTIEHDIRECGRKLDFGQKFIDLAKSVYITNDARAKLKREINTRLGSRLVEEKSYGDRM